MSLDRKSLALFILSAYGPTIFAVIGSGAVVPLISLTARHLGASVGLAAFVTALLNIGKLIGDIPAGLIADRIGEKWSIIAASVMDAILLATVFFFPKLWVLAVAICAVGMSNSVFNLARQSYLTAVVPFKYRARAMSSLGGAMRIGNTIGPLIGSMLVGHFDIHYGFGFAALMCIGAATVTIFLPDLPHMTIPQTLPYEPPRVPGQTRTPSLNQQPGWC